MKKVGTKIVAVHSEDLSDAPTLGNPDRRRIGKIHRTVSVPGYRLVPSRNVSQVEG
jgi:hypothetical protein